MASARVAQAPCGLTVLRWGRTMHPMALLAISADSHVTEPGDCYIDRIDPRFRDRAPVADDVALMVAVMDVDIGRSRLPSGIVAAVGGTPARLGPSLWCVG